MMTTVTPEEMKMQLIATQCAKLRLLIQQTKEGFTKLEEMCGTEDVPTEQQLDEMIEMIHQPYLELMLARIEEYWAVKFGCR